MAFRPKFGIPFNPKDWHPTDAEWIKERKKEWRQIREIHSIMDNPPRREFLPSHQKFFFYGEESTPYHVDATFKLWYHPGDISKFKDRVYKYSSSLQLESGHRTFFGNSSQPNRYPTSYGMLGGREKKIARLYVPSQYTDKTILVSSAKFLHEKPRKKEFKVCWNSPVGFLQSSSKSLRDILVTKDDRHNPYMPYLYLIEHWFSCFAWLNGGLDEKTEEIIKWHLKVVANYKKPKANLLQFVNGAKYVGKFADRLENGDTHEVLLAWWKKLNR